MSKFKVGDLVQEVTSRDFTEGTILEVIDTIWSYSYVVIRKGELRESYSSIIDCCKKHKGQTKYCLDQPLKKYEETNMKRIPERFPWAQGDKAYSGGRYSGGNKIRISGIKKFSEYEAIVEYYDQTDERNSSFSVGSCFANRLKPRGKKTKAKHAQWEKALAEQEKIKVGDWVEFIADDSVGHRTGDKFQIYKTSPEGRWIRSEKWDSWTEIDKVRKIEKPKPNWEGVKWAIRKGQNRINTVPRILKYFGEECLNEKYKPVNLEDLAAVQLRIIIEETWG